MSIRPPDIDDLSYEDLVAELLARIPAHTPDWTNPRPGDPGRTLIELFAWLGDSLLYRANLIPERQRLQFLQLLGVPLRSAIPARGLVSLFWQNPNTTAAHSLKPGVTITGPVNFETQTDCTVLPVIAQAFYKRPVEISATSELATVVKDLKAVYAKEIGTHQEPQPYETTAIFADGKPLNQGFDVTDPQKTVDGCLWLALLTAPADVPPDLDAIRRALGQSQTGSQQRICIGLAPAVEVPDEFQKFFELRPQTHIPHVWEITTGRSQNNQPEYLQLRPLKGKDSTAGLTRQGVIQLALPAAALIGAPSNEVRQNLYAGVGDRPPRLDNPALAQRLVAWIRLRPSAKFSLSWIGINAVVVDQRQTLRDRVIGTSNGTINQELRLPGLSVEAETLELEVAEPDQPYLIWRQIDDWMLAERNEPIFQLESDTGIVRFGDGLRGRVPPAGSRIRVRGMRFGGGIEGNLPPAALTGVEQTYDVDGKPVPPMQVMQPLPTRGGTAAETLEAAEQRIPGLFRHRDRAVTTHDYRTLAAQTPGMSLGRVEVLPRFKPQTFSPDIPGVISVMVLPQQDSTLPPNPRPDTPTLEAVHAYLDERRPLGTELYVIGCEYRPMSISVGVEIRDGFDRDAVLVEVRHALHRFLSPLVGGVDEMGWPLKRSVTTRELEVVVSRVAGISGVVELYLFLRSPAGWQEQDPISLKQWQLPELLSVIAVEGKPPRNLVPSGLLSDTPPFLNWPTPRVRDGGVAVPVVPDLC
ncbi:putative baseplate assembly protein [Leptolyngbya sp. AN02str]|uniref:putative baseplate assembly protein n=1 Tax=Leptolyngbya sp. AN02str TaxID=3423363 RepID=UPI003D318E75